MIYFQTKDEKHVLVLDASAMDALRDGSALVSPDSMVFLAFTPDENWTAEQFRIEFDTGEKKLTAERMREILGEAFRRPGAK